VLLFEERCLDNKRSFRNDLVFHLSSVCDVSHFFAVSRGHAADKALPLVRHLGCESGS
jgi:hypothetical protein